MLARTVAKGTNGYSLDLIIKLTAKHKMSLWCSKKEKFFSSDVYIRIKIENEMFCYVNGFLVVWKML